MKRALPLVALAVALAACSFGQKSMADMNKKELAMLKTLTIEQKAAKARLDKSPKDAKFTKAYIAATMKLADAQLVSPALTPKEKYPSSLRNYRIVLKLDPKHKVAREKVDMIESIYKSMGRPIPPN